VRRVCVFCGSSRGSDPRHAAAAAELGTLLGRRGLGLVFGGGSIGLMGVVADHVLAAGGRAIGVIPHGLAARELAHRDVADMRVVPTMHARKALMADLSDGFVALPGGIGTFEELLEITTWSQLGIHRKPIGILDSAGYYAPLLALVDRAVEEGFVTTENRALLCVSAEPAQLLDRMAAQRPPSGPAWISPDQT
jgi:uncharacterized protein (TIGR00730 family)